MAIFKSKFPLTDVSGVLGKQDRTVGRESNLAVNIRSHHGSGVLAEKPATPIARSAAFKARSTVYCACDAQYKEFDYDQMSALYAAWRAYNETHSPRISDTYRYWMAVCMRNLKYRELVNGKLFFVVPKTIGGDCTAITYPGLGPTAFYRQWNTPVGQWGPVVLFNVPICGSGTLKLYVRVNDDARIWWNGTLIYQGTAPHSCRLIVLDVSLNVSWNTINHIDIQVGEFGGPPSWLYEAWLEGPKLFLCLRP